MKIIAGLTFRNEANYLPIYLKNVLPIVDKIIAIDDQSTDNGKQILESAGDKVKVYSNKDFINKNGVWAEYSIRSKLLELAREEKVTHYVCLDADETFSTQFVPIARKVISKLEVGQKLALQWLPMWKSTHHYRDDGSVWSNNFKDFIVCDDGKSQHRPAPGAIGFDRTPGPNTNDNWMILNNKYGVVLHYQFVNWRNFQLKQCWYRINELIMQGQKAAKLINQKYSITLDEPNTFLRECPTEWIAGLETEHLYNLSPSWHLEKIKNWINEYGPEYFKDLDIWHVDEIKQICNKYT